MRQRVCMDSAGHSDSSGQWDGLEGRIFATWWSGVGRYLFGVVFPPDSVLLSQTHAHESCTVHAVTHLHSQVTYEQTGGASADSLNCFVAQVEIHWYQMLRTLTDSLASAATSED